MLVALAGMDRLRAGGGAGGTARPRRAAGGLRYVREAPALRIPLAIMALVGTLSSNFQVLMPLLASQTWHGTAAVARTVVAA